MHTTFSSVVYVMGHKTSLNKFKKIKIIHSIFHNHSSIKLEVNNMRKLENLQTKHTPEQWFKEEIKKGIKTKKSKQTKMEIHKTMGSYKNSS